VETYCWLVLPGQRSGCCPGLCVHCAGCGRWPGWLAAPVSDESGFEVVWPSAFGIHKNALYKSMALPFFTNVYTTSSCIILNELLHHEPLKGDKCIFTITLVNVNRLKWFSHCCILSWTVLVDDEKTYHLTFNLQSYYLAKFECSNVHLYSNVSHNNIQLPIVV